MNLPLRADWLACPGRRIKGDTLGASETVCAPQMRRLPVDRLVDPENID
jgi:hypothetical protein